MSAGRRRPPGAPQRLFFALWPGDALRHRLASFAADLSLPPGARRVPAGNLHLTLAFLGAIDPARRSLAEEAACGLRGRPFVLDLDRFGHWPRPRILWSAPTRPPEALAGLAGALRAALVERGFALEPRGFVPHLTLAREVRRMRVPQDHPRLRWPLDAFHLVESAARPEGARYRLVRAFALGPPELPCSPHRTFSQMG